MLKPQQKHASSPSRRDWIRSAAGGGALGSLSVLSTLLNLQATRAMADSSPQSDYKALVCVFLNGGNDSFNMLVPRSHGSNSDEYDDYVSARSGVYHWSSNPAGLAISESDLLAIDDPINTSGRSFGLHPGLGHSASGDLGLNGGVAKLYNDGNAAFVANIGSLIRPISRTDFPQLHNQPLGLFSHADFVRHWMTGAPDTRSQVTGWGGRIADLFQSTNTNADVSASISLSGTNLYSTGDQVQPFAIDTTGVDSLSRYNPGSADLQTKIFVKHFDSLLGQTYSNLISQSFADVHRGAADAAAAFNSAIGNVNLNTLFDQGDLLSKQMEMIAKTISVASQLGQTRQVFFVNFGGWDNHAGLITKQATNLPIVSRALKSFYDATVEIGCENDVVTFTASDFGRTLSTNGQGSDHGWGGNQLVMGGAVNGKRVVGDFPTSLLNPTHDFTSIGDGPNESLNLGRGRLIPTTGVDELAAELAIWFGVDNSTDLKDILPNIENFYQYSSGTMPLGILS